MSDIKYDSKKYNDKFKEVHKDELKEKHKCEICGGSYTYYNKSVHNKTRKHLNKMDKDEEKIKTEKLLNILLEKIMKYEN